MACTAISGGLAQAARGGDGLLGRGAGRAARAVPHEHERRFEYRALILGA